MLLLTLLALVPPVVLAQPPRPGVEVFTEARADLERARTLAEALRYEEAIVEYQRYLGRPERATERAKVLLELAFLYLVLEDTVSAEQRTTEALELDARVQAPPEASPKERELVERMRARLADRPRLEVLPREDAGRPQHVRARLKDPKARTSEVWLRHGPEPTGPYRATPMSCREGTCEGELPAPASAVSFTAWYFVEALDAEGHTVARAANPLAPLQLTVVEHKPWYASPWVYVGGAALVVGAASVFFIASEPRR